MDYSFPLASRLHKFSLGYGLILTLPSSFLIPKLSPLADFGAVLQAASPDCTKGVYKYIYIYMCMFGNCLCGNLPGFHTYL